MLMFGPHGTVINTERAEEQLPPEYLRMIAVLADTSAQIDVGLHCSRCGQDLQGANGHGDARWRLDCACRSFVGVNPIKAS